MKEPNKPVANIDLTPMRKRLTVLTVVVLALIGAGYATYDYTCYDRTPGFPALRLKTKMPEKLLVKTDGSPGQSFSAIFTVDGDRREVSGVTPAEFPLECAVLAAEITKFDGEGSFSFMIERQDGRGRFYTPPVKELRSFRYHSGTIGVLAQK